MLAAQLKDLQVTPASKGSKASQAPVHGSKVRVPAKNSVSFWSLEENEKLLAIVQSIEPFSWKCVAKSFENRSGFACQKRYERLTKSRKDL